MKSSSSFIAITSEGGLLPADFLHELPDPKTSIEGVTPVAYHLAEGERLNEQINRSWNRLKGCWENYKKTIAGTQANESTTTDTRERWLFPLFQELGFGRLAAAKPIEIDGRSYPISHGWNQVPIHLVGSHADLDHRTPGAVGAAKASPHSLVQSALNASDDHLWGILSNGFNLRLLRDNVALTRMAYVEFDLQAMFDGDLYSEFFVLWLVCHQSRFEGETPAQFWLERWKKAAEDKTLRALDDLYPGVKKAIASLGTGLVSNPANGALREKLRTGRLTTQEFYRQVLRVIYRMLFLLVAEDRALLHVADDSDIALKARSRYLDFYSIARLRSLTLYRAGTPHPDLWQVFQFVTVKLGGDTGCPELALPPLGSFLWRAADSTPDLLESLVSNRHFLEAIHALAFVQNGNVRRAVDYKNLGSEELGSVYQGLLEMHPRINADAGLFELDTAAGNERKTSGSYYTPDSLVQCLLDTALEPVIAQRLGNVSTPKEKEAALLSLKVCDMAAGSGHFILRAAHRIAHHLASVRSGEEEPSPSVYQTALRDVIGHCLYGVDINPMAVELCKVTLWLEALEPGKPLSFLDHHIRCGNSLLGTTPELISAGLPDETFEAIGGDDKTACSSLKRLNRSQREGLQHLFVAEDSAIRERMLKAATEIDELSDGRPEDIRCKEAAFHSVQADYDFARAWDLANLWCAAFVIKKHFQSTPSIAVASADDGPSAVQTGLFGNTEFGSNPKSSRTKSLTHLPSEIPFGITTQNLRDFVENQALPDGLLDEAKRIAEQYQFFHFHLAFPEIYSQGGFDVSLGNPPWEKVQTEELQFFSSRKPEIAALVGESRKRAIENLTESNPELASQWQMQRRFDAASMNFIRNSGLFRLTGVGKFNTFALFAELNYRNVSPDGRVGCIVPSGIATDDTTKLFFSTIVENKGLVSLFDFENREEIFAGVHRSYKFCLLTLCGKATELTVPIQFTFFAGNVSDLNNADKRFYLSFDDIILLNPNTRTCPIFRFRKDAELTKFIYRRIPVFFNETKGARNEYEPKVWRLLNTSDDSKEFVNVFDVGSDEPNPSLVPVVEAKTIHQFDHRHATFSKQQGKIEVRNVLESEKTDPWYCATARHYVTEPYFLGRVPQRLHSKQWFLTLRNIARSTDERTCIAAICSRGASCETTPYIEVNGGAINSAILLAMFNAFVSDYIARQKIGGTHLSYFIIYQLPTLSPSNFAIACPWASGSTIIRDWLLPRILELTYSAWDLEAFSQDCGWFGPPFRWDDERRFLLRCEIDAAFFHLCLGSETGWLQQPTSLTTAFPTPRAAVSYILDTFPNVGRKDEAKWAEYRTQRIILEIYDALAEAMSTGKTYQTRLNPAPASIMVAHPPQFNRVRVNFNAAGDYILPFVGSLLRHAGGEFDLMKLVRAYALLLGERTTLASLAEARFGAEAASWVHQFNQPVDASWFLPILRGLDNRDVIRLEERGDSDVFVRLLDMTVPTTSTVETDVYLILHLIDLNAVPPADIAEKVQTIAPKAIRVSLHEATPILA